VAALSDSTGAALPVGSQIRLGTFANLSGAEILALAAQGPAAVNAALLPFGQTSAVGNGSTGAAGTLEFTASEPLAAGLADLYALVLNATNTADATELLLLKISSRVPADDPSGLPGYLAVHLRHAELIYGTPSGAGFSTGAAQDQPSGFATWITAQLGAGAAPEDLAEDADADHDGFPNLLEYALGSQAGSGSSLATLELVTSDGQRHVQYLRRNDDATLSITCELQVDPAAPAWTVLTSPVVVIAEPAAPAGYERVRRLLPESPAGRAFARLRVAD